MPKNIDQSFKKSIDNFIQILVQNCIFKKPLINFKKIKYFIDFKLLSKTKLLILQKLKIMFQLKEAEAGHLSENNQIGISA